MAYYHEGNDVDVFVQNHDSVASGVLAASEESWLQTTVQGSGTLTFHLKRAGDGTSTFTLDGETKHTGSGNLSWTELSYTVEGMGEHTFKWKYTRPASPTSDPNGLWVDYVQWYPDDSTTALQKALENDHPFTTGGAPDYHSWGLYASSDAHYDGDCAESDSDTGNSEESTLEMEALGSGTFSFYWSVSSEQNGDYLKFYIDGTLKDSISGEVAWQQKSYTVSGTGEHTFKWVYKKDGSGTSGDDRGLVDFVQWDGSYAQSLTTAIATNSDDAEEEGDGTMYLSGDLPLGTDGGDDPTVGLRFTNLTIPQGAIITKAYVEFEAESTESEDAQVTVKAEDTDDAATFTTTDNDITDRTTTTASVSYWLGSWTDDEKYQSAELKSVIQEVIDRTGWSSGNDLALIISCTDSDTHYAQSSTGTNTYPPVLHVEYVRTGVPADWETIKFTYDHSGRRIEKNVDHTITRYTYGGGNVIAEYKEDGDQLRKYLYGPGIDEPISMTEVIDSNAVYYYHTDGLGSVVALTNADGNSVQTYVYSIYGQVAAEDPNHTNPYMFAGRRFDSETGLYYNRARYYNPYTGRFMQTDPIGYGDGMNWYAYTGNNPVNLVDPSGKFEIVWGRRIRRKEYKDFREDLVRIMNWLVDSIRRTEQETYVLENKLRDEIHHPHGNVDDEIDLLQGLLEKIRLGILGSQVLNVEIGEMEPVPMASGGTKIPDAGFIHTGRYANTLFFNIDTMFNNKKLELYSTAGATVVLHELSHKYGTHDGPDGHVLQGIQPEFTYLNAYQLDNTAWNSLVRSQVLGQAFLDDLQEQHIMLYPNEDPEAYNPADILFWESVFNADTYSSEVSHIYEDFELPGY